MNRRRLIGTSAALATAIGLSGSRHAVWANNEQASPEATPGSMTGIAPIRWQVVAMNSAGETATPTEDTASAMGDKVYTLQFFPDGNLGIQADCNVGRATYRLDGENIAITQGVSTLVACEDMATSDQFWTTLTGAAMWSITIDASDQLTISANDGSSLVLDPTLPGVVWQWQEFQSGDGSVVKASDPTQFTLEFMDDGSVQAQVDCNSGRADLAITGSSIELVLATTRKLCSEDSQDGQYLDWLGQATSWVIRGDTLNLALPMDAGILVYKAYVDVAMEEATPVS